MQPTVIPLLMRATPSAGDASSMMAPASASLSGGDEGWGLSHIPLIARRLPAQVLELWEPWAGETGNVCQTHPLMV